MKHLLFFHLTLSYSIGLPSLVVLILAFHKSRIKMLINLFNFLALVTLHFIFLAYAQYQCANNSSWYTYYYDLINNIFSCLMVVTLPPTINEWFNARNRVLINILFGSLFLISLALIIGPLVFGISKERYVGSLFSFKIFLGILIFTVLFMLYTFITKFPNISDSKERIFWIFSFICLLIVVSQFIMPIFNTFPESLIIPAAAYFFWNLALLKYSINRYLINSLSDVSSRDIINRLTLTDREKEILFLLFQGQSNQKIGTQLFISEDTVKTHIKNIYKKLRVNNRVQLFNLLKDNHY